MHNGVFIFNFRTGKALVYYKPVFYDHALTTFRLLIVVKGKDYAGLALSAKLFVNFLSYNTFLLIPFILWAIFRVTVRVSNGRLQYRFENE